MKKTLKYLSLGLLSTILTATPGLGAERISFFFPPLGEFSLSADSLELFAKEGKINNELGFYAQRATPQQLAQLRDLLQQRFNLTPTLVSQFTYSPIGEEVVRRLGELVLTDSRQNGFFALRAALILAAADPQGLTVVNVLRKYPSNTVRLNFAEGLGIVKNLSELLKTRDAVVTFIQKEVNTGVANSTVDFSQQPDLRLPGTFGLEKINFTFNDSKRERQLPVDLYLPQATPQSRTNAASPPFPLIVISHGLASDRYAFIYLAQHLASHGFAVAVLEHPGSNAERFQQFFAGLAGPPDAKELINRPMDVKYVLDELQQLEKSDPKLQGKLNFQQVGAIGHSYGGYTVLSLAGAKINFQQIRRVCKPNRSLNLSVLLQCSATDLLPINYQLKDDRIKVVIAVNPFNSSIFSQSGVSQIQVPVMLVGSSQDIVTPVVPEQIIPFTWLPNPNKYLALIENATHFTAIAEPTPENSVLPVPPALLGPNPAPAYSYLRALSVAFLETHLLKRPEYRSYLQPSYAQYISKEPLNLSLVQSLTADQLAQALNGASRQSAAPASP
ncbi:putative dienelactone hydrolase [Cylindrospermum stagnale PCC 7417]|uniref:Putative dienelactone hydrolase n=1 Tax=Cylindrospermum stagnale PCC 7417 TaxID=56107 RepID=K9X0T9_9NOST|nr:alpha/beta hydrolase [Cylindrospermum stagnale]AFZ26230.1 putative dienelactone hydrolase [Cylindrospermum stagnale PCC 7417]